MKKFSLSLLALATLGLTACGGSDDATPVAVNTPTANTATSTNTSTNTTTRPTTSGAATSISVADSIHGQAISADDDSAFSQNVSSTNINQLIVGGQTYAVSFPNISAGAFSDMNTSSYHSVASGTHMSYAKYGFYEDKATDREYYYYQGQKTPAANVPTTGTATYTGQSVYDCDGCNDQIITGTSTFNVDFAAKTLTGTVSNNRANVALTANISGNNFTGTAADGTVTNGAFFGTNAEELAGVYKNAARDFGGAFGAKK